MSDTRRLAKNLPSDLATINNEWATDVMGSVRASLHFFYYGDDDFDSRG
jgi:hypothetical protein